MSSAVKTLVNWIFEKTELIRIIARVFANNFASIKVLEKNGFSAGGIFFQSGPKEWGLDRPSPILLTQGFTPQTLSESRAADRLRGNGRNFQS
jgi:RimJ/RimL family protein N-acetyltransferase